jgi:SagB-type dehydrogenase family enzyme
MIKLPPAQTSGGTGLNKALATRRSVRRFGDKPLTREQIGQLAWSAQGASGERGYRTAPSAGALYPLQLLVATADGLYVYKPDEHALGEITTKDLRREVARAALGQTWIGEAAAVFVVAGNIDITAEKYGSRARRYVWQETGHAAQNLLLQATGMGLGGTPVGAFDDERLSEVLRLPKGWQPMYVLPVGVPG